MARRRDDDEDDDRPRRRSRRDDDDDDEDGDDDRDSGGIPAGTPRVYVHDDCKCKTTMPAKYVREYLENPFELGEQPTTRCAECEEDVPWKDCYWADTKQNLYEYIDDMRAEMVVSGNDPRTGPTLAWWLPLIVGVVGGLVIGAGGRRAAGLGLMAGVAAAVVGAIAGAVWMFVQHSQDKKASAEWNRKLVARYYKRHPERKKQKPARRRADDEDDD